jgi:FkbM family methyltransferase
MLNKEDVVWGFRYMLGRDPESPDVIAAHSDFNDWKQLRDALRQTEEYNGLQSFRPFPRKWVLTPVHNGRCKMWVDLADTYVSRGCLLDAYETNETNFIRKHLKQGDVFADIGANLGWFTLLASTIVGPSGHVHAFEPQPETFRRFSDTLNSNDLGGGVTAYHCGLSNRPGELFINHVVDTDNMGGAFIADTPVPGMVSAKVQSHTLDSLNLDRLNFIKIDVEGAEHKALLGGQKTILRNRPIILSEVNRTALKNVSGVSAGAFIQYLVNLGYRSVLIDEGGVGREVTSDLSGIDAPLFNIACFPR